jgi:hypothetical protein
MWIYLKFFLHFILSRFVIVFFNFQQLSQAREMKYINIITWLLLCLLIFSTTLAFLTFFWRNVQSKVQLRNKKHLARLEGDLILYLYDEKFEAVLLEQLTSVKGYKRQLLIGLIGGMSSQLLGQSCTKLKRLYIEIFRLKPHGTYQQYMGHLKQGFEAHFPFERMKNSSQIISEWEQIHMHNNFVKYNAKLPDLSIYLTAKNPSLVVFCRRLMSEFRQGGVLEKLPGS